MDLLLHVQRRQDGPPTVPDRDDEAHREVEDVHARSLENPLQAATVGPEGGRFNEPPEEVDRPWSRDHDVDDLAALRLVALKEWQSVIVAKEHEVLGSSSRTSSLTRLSM